jgi:hypothetical protein
MILERRAIGFCEIIGVSYLFKIERVVFCIVLKHKLPREVLCDGLAHLNCLRSTSSYQARRMKDYVIYNKWCFLYYSRLYTGIEAGLAI